MPDTAAPRRVVDGIERLVDRHRAEGLEPGLAYGVVRAGELVHAGGRGECRPGGAEPDADTVFRIASMTKSFTAATVLLLRDARLLRLDDEVAAHVPEAAALRPPTVDAPALTVRSLLTMTAGFPTDDPWGDRQQDLPDDDFGRLLDAGLSFAWTPGTAFEYSNLGYALLGRVIASAAGEPYPDVVTRRLLAPLAMSSTGYTTDVAPDGRLAQGYRRTGADWAPVPFAGYGSFAPMGGLFSTVRDLARWVGGLAAAFPPRDGPDDHPLRRASRRELQLPHLALPPVVTWRSVAEPPTVRGAAYGFGLVVERDPRFGTLVSHSGGYPGFGSHMRWHPATGLGVIVLGNATYTPVPRLGSMLMDALLAGSLPDAGPRRPGASPAPASGSMVAATAVARDRVTQLFSEWDDELAGRLFAMNVDLDDPLENRRAELARLADTLGPFEPDELAGVSSSSPAHCAWWLRGRRGRVRVEIRLTPERPPRVQTLAVTAVPDPAPRHRRIADRVAELLGHPDPRWPGDLPLAPPLTPADLERQLQVGGAWAGASVVEGAIAGDGRRESTFRLDGGRLALQLTLTADPVTGTVIALTLTPDVSAG